MIDVLQMVPFVPEVQADLEARYRVHAHPAPEAALAGIRAVATDAIVGLPREVAEALPALEIVASAGVGYDALHVPRLRERGVRACYTPDVLNDAVAELAIGLMLAHARRIAAYDAYARDGRWAQEGFPPLTAQLAGARIGLLGLGRIGREVADRAAALKMRVAYHARSARPGLDWEYHETPEALAEASDWLVAILPATPETRGIVGREVLRALGPEGVFVNIGRGALHDEDALIELLGAGALGGAALDVFADEPAIPEALRQSPRVTLSPHMGSATHVTRRAMGRGALDNLDAHFAGRPLPSEIPA